MGKRSDFERISKDHYRTFDPRAVSALAPHIEKVSAFIEPCAGKGDLIRSLENLGKSCVLATDIADYGNPRIQIKDVMEIEEFPFHDAVITNPPWDRKILHPMIEKFMALTDKPIWLLFDADWMHTKQSADLMKHCLSVVSIGRLIWIPGTTMTGKDNCCWYQFTREKVRTSFYGR